jgi:hypothetical protein
MMVEVSDTTLLGRNAWFLNNVSNAYLNDNFEIWYTFEQDPNQEITGKKIAADAMNGQKYVINRTSTYNGRPTEEDGWMFSSYSTHYKDIEVKSVTAKFSDTYATTGMEQSGKAEDGTRAPSYRVELKMPARTEGAPDTANFANVNPMTGYAGEARDYWPEGEAGDKQYQDALKNEANYKFTAGEALKAGDYIRLSLQVNDLIVPGGQNTLNNQAYGDGSNIVKDGKSDCHEDQELASQDKTTTGNKFYLYNSDNQEVIPWFSPKGQSQQHVKDHLIFGLGNDGTAMNTVYGFDAKQKPLSKAEVDAYNATENGKLYPVVYSPNLAK